LRILAIPTYPPSGAEFRERPPSRRAQRYLPTLARCPPAPRPYLPTLAQVFPIAAVTYLPGQRDATLARSATVTASQCPWPARQCRVASPARAVDLPAADDGGVRPTDRRWTRHRPRHKARSVAPLSFLNPPATRSTHSTPRRAREPHKIAPPPARGRG
jgi:hypothetical protein